MKKRRQKEKEIVRKAVMTKLLQIIMLIELSQNLCQRKPSALSLSVKIMMVPIEKK